jgi:hypothetical protein
LSLRRERAANHAAAALDTDTERMDISETSPVEKRPEARAAQIALANG